MPEDAAFIHGLRTDPAYNTHLSPVTGTVADQRAWITAYKTREAAGAELYYIIERRDRVPCGAVRLYDITTDSFTWGSWILNADKPPKAALESALLSFSVGFVSLRLCAVISTCARTMKRSIEILSPLRCMVRPDRMRTMSISNLPASGLFRVRDTLCEKLEA